MIEVTEHSQVSDYAALGAALKPAATARIAIDDVGSGYAGLRHIVDLRPDILKLDMSLTRQIGRIRPAVRWPTRWCICREMAVHCRRRGRDRSRTRSAGPAEVPLAQGYLFSRPMPVVAAQQVLLGQSGRPPRRSG